MSKFKYSDEEKKINKVLNYQDQEIKEIKPIEVDKLEERIKYSENLIQELGYCVDIPKVIPDSSSEKIIVVPSWEELYEKAESIEVGDNLESLFSPEELSSNSLAVKELNDDFNSIYKLDKLDLTLCISAGILSSIVDILLVGIPQKTPDGLKAGSLSNYVRDRFDKKFPEDEMEKLANSKVSKVPYDAQDNRNTKEYVEGLSAYYHRLLSLGHDPLLGLVIGVADILNGKMTTIDKNGKIISQVIENYADRKESKIFLAIAKQVLHFKSDITTSMGLPAPLMSLFNLIQFGSIGEAEQTVAEIVQGMYYEGYDFIHFSSMSIPTMLIEVIVRLGYAFKRIREGRSIKDSIPISLNREKNPKLSTMLFTGHSMAVAINAGKVIFTKNPMAINYPQWIAFIKYSYTQLKWVMIEKPELRDSYVKGKIMNDLESVYKDIDKTFDELGDKYIVVFN